MSIFPIFNDNAAAPSRYLPLMKEIVRDPNTGKTIWRNGEPVIVSGAEAVASWAIAALYSRRRTSPANSGSYGSEFHSLLGSAFTEDVKTAIVPGILKDTLLPCPYISDVKGISTSFSEGRLSCEASLQTIYGEVTVHVYDNKNL